MKKTSVGKKFLKEAAVLFIITLMLLSSIVVMADTNKNEVRLVAAGSNGDFGEPEKSRDEFFLGFYDEYTIDYDALGLTGGTPPYTWRFAIKLTPDELQGFIDHQVIAARFYHHEEINHDGTLFFYDQGASPNIPGSTLASKAYSTGAASGWVRVDLTTPFQLNPTRDLWVAFRIISGEQDFPASVDAGPAVDGKGDWANLGGPWEEVQDYGFDYNFCIDAIVEGDEPIEPLEVEIDVPSEGIVGEEIQFESTVTGGVEPYTYAWDFGDESGTSDEEDPTYIYDEVGEYLVELTVTDDVGTEKTVNDTISIIAVPAELEITAVSGFLGISVTIKNIGASDATNVEWEIQATGGFLGLIDFEGGDTEAALAAGAEVTVSSGMIGIGLGSLEIAISADADNADKVSVDATAFIIGPFVIGVSIVE